MINFWKKVVKYRVLILIGSVLLLIPATLGYLHTRVNYDVLTYLPDDIETMQGQDILVNDFNTGAFSMFIVDGMEDKDVSALKAKIEQVDHVEMISSLCILMARGALISMVVVIFVLPSVFMVFDKVIVKTSKGFLPK